MSAKTESLQKKTARADQKIRKRDRITTEERLIKAGTEVFSKYGFDAATTKMISQKSGVNESLIMRYFGGKEGLLIEIIRRFFAESHATPLSYAPQDSLEAELVHFTRGAFEEIKKNNAIIRIMLLRAAIDPKMKKKVQSFINTEGNPNLIERIEILKAKSKIPAHLDANLFHLIAFQSISTIFLSDILFGFIKQKEILENLEKLVSHTVQGIFTSK